MNPSHAARPRLSRLYRVYRPAVHGETLLALTAAFIMLAGNGRFWHAALAGRPWSEPATWLFAGAIFVTLACFYFAAAALVSSRRTVRPVLALCLLVTAAASYYMDRYAIYLDRAMVRNVLATNYKEAVELLGWGMARHMLLFGIVPAGLLWWPVLERRSWRRAAAVRAAWIAGAVLLGVGSALAIFADFASLVRNQPEVRHLVTPGNAVASLMRNAWGHAARGKEPLTVVAADAHRIASGKPRPMLFVLVVGETARAQNFSLNGYPRETNPELARRNVINFPDATACGTSTEVSLPCMFSVYGRGHYDEDKILSHESVLHVLARTGVQVVWRDNQSGCKGVCKGLPDEQLSHAKVPALCANGQCLDEILVHGMDRLLQDANGNMLVVMHQLGSHGPAYFRRYPPAFRKFLPACESDELRQCTQQEIVNAYDNSILYTDAVLGKVIDFLQGAQATHDTAMLYVSDHGESLGEGGLYLHGMPWAIAPQVQTRVPFVLWLSPAFRAAERIDEACLRTRARTQAVSHDWLFNTLLGTFDVRTRAYDPALDVFAACRSPRSREKTTVGMTRR